MTERDIKCRRVSCRQLQLLWEYLNSHRSIAGAYNSSLAAKAYSESKWKEVADRLNAEGEGAYKDWRGWSKYWVDYKAKLKKKAAFVSSTYNKTGGGPPTEPLTLIELNLLNILGQDFDQGLPGVQVEPFPQSSITLTMGSSTQASTVSDSILRSPQELLSPGITLPISTPAHELSPPPTSTPAHALSPPPTSTLTHARPPATPTNSPYRRRRRRNPPMTQEAARRALVQSSQMRAEATVRLASAAEMMAQTLLNIENILQKVIKD